MEHLQWLRRFAYEPVNFAVGAVGLTISGEACCQRDDGIARISEESLARAGLASITTRHHAT